MSLSYFSAENKGDLFHTSMTSFHNHERQREENIIVLEGKMMYRNGGNIKIMLTQHINIVPFFPVSSLLFPQEEFKVEASLLL